MCGIKIERIKIDDVPILECELVYKDSQDNVRMYIKRLGPGHGFKATALEFVSCIYGQGSHWERPDLTVEIIVEVIAYFDGLRHLHFGGNGPESDDFNGYLYYPSSKSLVEVMTKLRELEQECCSMVD